MKDEYFEFQLKSRRAQAHVNTHGRTNRWHENGFRCVHCRVFVSAEPILAGVNNRNHCPYCLWSRHMDLYKPGDRLCACKAYMQPIGLTLKKCKQKYGHEPAGELMIIHQCKECGKLSINRMAADDDTERILEIFESSQNLDSSLTLQLWETGIELLGIGSKKIIHRRLMGYITD